MYKLDVMEEIEGQRPTPQEYDEQLLDDIN